jgi:hypothetical protein
MTKGLFLKSPFRGDAENGQGEFSARLCDVSAKILSLTNMSPARLSTAASIKSDHTYTHHDFLPSAQQEKSSSSLRNVDFRTVDTFLNTKLLPILYRDGYGVLIVQYYTLENCKSN